MLSKPHVQRALEAKADSFRQFEQQSEGQRLDFLEHLASFEAQSKNEIDAEFALLSGLPTGIRPTDERVAGQSVVKPFEPRWANHAQARQWALETLLDVPTAAVDGSQISNSPDLSPPVAAIQVGWFINEHSRSNDYVKDIQFEVLSPDELAAPGTQIPSQGMVDLRRFESECDIVCRLLEQHADRARALVMFDGSFAISCAAQLRPLVRRRYIQAVRQVLQTSLETKVPVAAFVDTSHAIDLVRGLALLSAKPMATHLDDASLLRPSMARWGDRSEALIVDRKDDLFQDDPDLAYYGDLALVYLKTTSDNPPARIELPRWVLDQGLVDDVTNLILAECVAEGNGYPYAFETVDAVAVISANDRDMFYRAFRHFGSEIGVPVRYSRKASSKRGRR